jgi:hypothetical protein
MSSDQQIAYDLGGIADYGHTLSTISAELDNVTHSATGILSGIQEYFTTHHASGAFNEVHNLLMQGIQEGKDTILRHGHTVGQAAENFSGTDIAAGQSFYSV